MKTMNYNNVKGMILQPEELTALEKANQILHEVWFHLGGDNIVMSLETGECIVPSDLATACGVLGFVRNCRMVEVNPT